MDSAPVNLPETYTREQVDRYYLAMALAESENSDDPKALRVSASGVGAVIASKAGVLATSANVLPPALKHFNVENGLAISEADRYHVIEHAERAAIMKALLEHKPIYGATIYCTRFPCSDCARSIVWAGIRRVVLSAGFSGESKWLEAQRAAMRILRNAGVTVRILGADNLERQTRNHSGALEKQSAS